ncbi:DUF4139 domain-containing protein [Alterisphingorhabdus coralli]|uniref:DUF4139 domain-containing protein n=1 Tax=Alterisphingorhabdus coralli TaxID=3071408 RepID=A0AA97I1W0_9SPHN|nr:DUF4139 domain-containing protein [Parasphingorhabdus sp. SCSIO 66989]WOE75723.1 DUF4139 domain-containing protein [Parasphingorhabdus sp. SCSIO 66989]
MRFNSFAKSAAAIVVFTALSAQTAPTDKSAQGDVAVTIYNNNQALIRDERRVNVPAGTTRIPFPDVSAQIRPETVTLNGDGFDIVEQNFDYDLLSPGALMAKAVGQTVTLLRTNPATGAETRERAKILAVNGGVVMQIGSRIEVLRDDGLPVRVIFDRIPPNLRAKPTLSITLDSARGGTRPLALSYLSQGLGWGADYVALFDEGTNSIDVQGWITLTNNTGTTFENARTLLVAGSVGQVNRRRGRSSTRGNRPGTESADRERLGDFYIYPLEKRTTIANAQQKQVSFLDVSGAPSQRGYQFTNGWLNSSDEARSVNSVIKFSTSDEGGLGDALPAGTIRIYERDARGNAQFIGESGIGHTPGGSELALTTGEAFDIKVQPILVKRSRITSDEWESSARYRIRRSDGSSETMTVERPKQYFRSEMRYVVTNASNRPVTVDLAQRGLRRFYYSDTRVPSESIPGTQRNADTRVWQVPVPANGETVLTVTFDTGY